MHRESLWQISHGKGESTEHRVGTPRQCALPLPVPVYEAAPGPEPDGGAGLRVCWCREAARACALECSPGRWNGDTARFEYGAGRRDPPIRHTSMEKTLWDLNF